MNVKMVFMLVMLIVPFAGCGQSNDQLLKDIQSDNRQIRLTAAGRLGLVASKDPVISAKLVSFLETGDDRTKLIAIQVLGATEDSTLIEPLSKMLDHPNYAIRECAVRSLGAIGSRAAGPYLTRALSDSTSTVRYSAVAMLGHIQCPEVVPQLFTMFRDPVDSVRAITVQTLYQYRANRWANINASDLAVPINDRSDLVRYATAQALGISYPDSTLAGDLLIQTLNDTNKYVRLKAIISLRQLNYEPAIPYLKTMYDLSTVEEELEITDTIKAMTGEVYPPEEPVKK